MLSLIGWSRERASLRGILDARYRVAKARFLLKRSMRLPVALLRSTPVKAGWQFEQTSTTIASAVDLVRNVFPHDVQRISIRFKCGCLFTSLKTMSRSALFPGAVAWPG